VPVLALQAIRKYGSGNTAIASIGVCFELHAFCRLCYHPRSLGAYVKGHGMPQLPAITDQTENKSARRGGRLPALARGVALFLGLFSVLNVVAEWFIHGFDANIWWIDLRPLPLWARQASMLGMAVVAAWAVAPGWFARSRRLRRAMMFYLLALAGICVINSAVYYRLLSEGDIRSSLPLPLSLVMALLLALVLAGVVRTSQTPPSGLDGATLWIGISFALCTALFPLAQMVCFGLTDYRRPADAIVVFGAGIGSDGTPSQALYDRVRTGCLLYKQGLAPVLIFSGGREPTTDEPTVMKRLAVKMGVPDKAIMLDPDGLNTDATVANCRAILPAIGARRILAVSHFYHLPRVKMTFARADIETYTVPAEETRHLRALPYYMAREVAAMWAYYFRPMR
jgi:uncharacterized SAM-binding protein YcdF (DUF218 family)